MTAPYAVGDEALGGRRFVESPDVAFTPFELDRFRIVSCTAFRRLEGKTQVFAPDKHDHFRTRLTHTLEVSQVARTLARLLRANETLAESIALAHDLGHPPFGHAGEVALNEAMVSLGGFNHNTHSLRVVDYLEHPFPPFRGLNLTGETRSGLAAHCTRYDAPDDQSDADMPAGASAEAQIASVADRLAYNCHDLEDAIGGELIGIEDLSEVALWREALKAAPGCDTGRPIHAIRRVVLDAIVHRLLRDVAETSSSRLGEFRTAESVKEHDGEVVLFSQPVDAMLEELERFLVERVYHHPAIVESDETGKRMIFDLFQAFTKDPGRLPRRFASRIGDQGTARVIGDYIAGMTDRYCRREYNRLSVEQ